MKQQPFIVISIFCFILSCSKEDSPSPIVKEADWEQIKDFPGTARKDATSFWIGDKFYVGFGSGFVNNVQMNLNDFYEFNSTTKSWKKITNFPGLGRESATAFSIGNKGYIGFGRSTVNCNPTCSFINYHDIWEYDPLSDAWKTLGDFNQLSGFPESFVIKDKAYIIFYSDLWVFDPSNNSLTKIGALPESTNASSGFVISDLIYLMVIKPTGLPLQIMFYEFNPVTTGWTRKTDFAGQARVGASGFSFDNKGYITSGRGYTLISPGTYQQTSLNDTWEYNPLSNTWVISKKYPGAGWQYQTVSNSSTMACVGTGEPPPPITFFANDFWLFKYK